MKFIVTESKIMSDLYQVVKIDKEPHIVIAVFHGDDKEGFLSKELAPLLAGDYCDFLNDKYVDKDFNEEWGKIQRERRIKYHKEQLKLLEDNGQWNEHGNGIEAIKL